MALLSSDGSALRSWLYGADLALWLLLLWLLVDRRRKSAVVGGHAAVQARIRLWRCNHRCRR